MKPKEYALELKAKQGNSLTASNPENYSCLPVGPVFGYRPKNQGDKYVMDRRALDKLHNFWLHVAGVLKGLE